MILLEFIRGEVNPCGPLEEAAVRIRSPGVLPVVGPLGRRVVQPFEQAMEIVLTRPLRIPEAILDDPREAMLGNLAEILGEEAPDRLEDEVPQHVEVGSPPFLETLVQARRTTASRGERRLAAGEDGLRPRQEEKGVVLIRKVDQVELDARLLRVLPGSQISR